MKKRYLSPTSVLALIVLVQCLSAQDTELSYQGSLNNTGSPANGTYDFEFVLFDALAAGNQVGPIVTREPLLVTRNDKGEIEGVKYAQITTVLVNAANELQKQIEEQRDLIRTQQSEIGELKAFICSQNPAAAFCLEKKL